MWGQSRGMSGSGPVAPSELGHRPEPSSPLSLVPRSKAPHHLGLCVTQRRTREGGRCSESPRAPRGPVPLSPPSAPSQPLRLQQHHLCLWSGCLCPGSPGTREAPCATQTPRWAWWEGLGIYTHHDGDGFHIPADTALLRTPPCPLGLLHQGPLSDTPPSAPPGWTGVCVHVCAQRSLGTPARRASRTHTQILFPGESLPSFTAVFSKPL